MYQLKIMMANPIKNKYGHTNAVQLVLPMLYILLPTSKVVINDGYFVTL